jgi:hypothetical protein
MTEITVGGFIMREKYCCLTEKIWLIRQANEKFVLPKKIMELFIVPKKQWQFVAMDHKEGYRNPIMTKTINTSPVCLESSHWKDNDDVIVYI